MRHTTRALAEMQEAIDRARISDANEARGLLRAAALAVYAPGYYGTDEHGTDEHDEWLTARLAELRMWLKPVEEAMVGVPREDVWADIVAALGTFGADVPVEAPVEAGAR